MRNSEIRNRQGGKEEESSGSQPDYRISNNSCILASRVHTRTDDHHRANFSPPPLPHLILVYLREEGGQNTYPVNRHTETDRERESSLPYNNIILVRGDVYSRCIEKILSIERERERARGTRREWRARAHDRPCGGGSAARGGERENLSVVDPASLGGTTTMRSSGM